MGSPMVLPSMGDWFRYNLEGCRLLSLNHHFGSGDPHLEDQAESWGGATS